MITRTVFTQERRAECRPEAIRHSLFRWLFFIKKKRTDKRKHFGGCELAHFFIAEYHPDMKVGKGGGLEGVENVTTIEMDYPEAKENLQQGKFLDAKTIMLLQYFFMNEEKLQLNW